MFVSIFIFVACSFSGFIIGYKCIENMHEKELAKILSYENCDHMC
jgi:hypothetical protein